MIFEGNQATVLPNTNERLSLLKGYLNEEEARISFCEYLRANLAVTVELMAGIKLYPFQEMIIRSMFQKDFFLLICGRGLSKSFCASIFCWLYAVMNPGIRIGLLASSFRQSRIVFQYIERAATKGGALLAQCFNGTPSHKNDEFVLRIGSSTIIALPLGSSGKLRGFRFNVVVVDELLLMPPNIINEVIMPFLSVNFDPVKRDEIEKREEKLLRKGLISKKDLTQFINPKFIGLSSASYKFEFLYKLYEEYSSKIYNTQQSTEKNNNTISHGVIKLSYDMAPPNLLNLDTIKSLQSQMSEAQFQREFGAVFTDDSGGFFSKRKMDNCTIESGSEPTIEIAGDKDIKYILAIDPSFSKAASSDHYAMTLIKLNEEKRKGIVVHNYAIAGGQLQDHMKYFSYLLRYFNIVYVIIDNAGHWFVDECNASVIFSEHNLKLDFFEADFENQNYLEGLKIAKNSYNLLGKKICHAQKFNPEWIRLANERLAASFDHQTMWFAAPAIGTKYETLKRVEIPLDELVYDNQGEKLEGLAKKADFIEHQTDLIDLVKSETALIEIKSSPTGNQTFQLPTNLRRSDSPDRARKDNYTTLLLANWAMKSYWDMLYTDMQDSPILTPFFIR